MERRAFLANLASLLLAGTVLPARRRAVRRRVRRPVRRVRTTAMEHTPGFLVSEKPGVVGDLRGLERVDFA